MGSRPSARPGGNVHFQVIFQLAPVEFFGAHRERNFDSSDVAGL
jgi:hypothetical protein